ncbi:RING finger protein 151 [Galendromus occidentalis]|uniref:RING finger protein 151 n=1 Tax=Galendromus occidentalis TaxID=34638 RepID=A0AAJ7L7R5_9ACAR|nr:RING finger protein 151 [Galendromus occidentalis]
MEDVSRSTRKAYTFVGFSKKSYWYRAKLDEFPINYICLVCQCVTPKLNTLPCGHWTCDLCLKGMTFREKTLSRKMLKCALCRKTCDEVSMTTKVAKSDIQKKSAHCAQTGCNFSGSLRDIKRHSPFCVTKTMVKCVGCENLLRRSSLSRHLRDQCSVDASLPTPSPPSSNGRRPLAAWE